MNLKILATFRNPDLVETASLTFKTVRIGFPTADIQVDVQNLVGADISGFLRDAESVGASVNILEKEVVHGAWIKDKVENNIDPFWICDTDVVFFGSMEKLKLEAFSIAGEYVPRFRCPVTRCCTEERLHTGLMYINPFYLCNEILDFQEKYNSIKFTPCADLFLASVEPYMGEPVFFDTCSKLYHATFGTYEFKKRDLKKFIHLQCGTWIDIVSDVFPGMKDVHKLALSSPEMVKGLRDVYQKFYRSMEE